MSCERTSGDCRGYQPADFKSAIFSIFAFENVTLKPAFLPVPSGSAAAAAAAAAARQSRTAAAAAAKEAAAEDIVVTVGKLWKLLF